MEKNSGVESVSVGFFLPTYNNLDDLKKAILSILPLEVPFMVGLDGSTDGTREWLDEHGYPYLFHPNHENRGRAATRNLALQLNWHWIIFMDSDLIFTGSIQPFFKDYSNVHVYVGTVSYEYRKSEEWLDYCSSRGANKNKNGNISYKSFSTGICAVPSPLFQHLKGFDEQFIHYGGEDLEFAIRAKNNHSPIFKSSSLKGHSFEKKTLNTALNQLHEFGKTGLKIIVKKHPMHSFYGLKSKIPSTFENLVKKLITYLPPPIKRWGIHYLVYCSVKKGFYSNKI